MIWRGDFPSSAFLAFLIQQRQQRTRLEHPPVRQAQKEAIENIIFRNDYILENVTHVFS